MHCEICEEEKPEEKLNEEMTASGRDYGGVGGAPRPPEIVVVCDDCMD